MQPLSESSAIESVRFHNYSVAAVHGRMTLEWREAVVAMWWRNRLLPTLQAAWQRVDEVAMMIRAEDGTLVGVATVYEAGFREPEDRYWFYRMFIEPKHRVPGMMRFVTLWTREYFRDHHLPGGPKDVILITENPKLKRPGMRRMFERNGYEYLGSGPRGNDIWCASF